MIWQETVLTCIDMVEGHNMACGGSRNPLNPLFCHNPQSTSKLSQGDSGHMCLASSCEAVTILAKMVRRI